MMIHEMYPRTITIFGTMLIGLGFSGCESTLTTDLTIAAAAVNADVAAAQTTLTKIASTTKQACSTIGVAEGYFNAVAATGALPSSATSAETTAASIVSSICAGAPTTLSAVSGTLGAAWAVIQAATTKP